MTSMYKTLLYILKHGNERVTSMYKTLLYILEHGNERVKACISDKA